MTAGSPAGQGSRSYAPEEAVTGEGVALELPVANLGTRALSGLIDVIAHVGLLIGVFFLTRALTGQASEAVSRTGMIVALVAVLVGVPTVSETLSRGRTLGKLITGLRVVRDDGGPISFRHALARALVGWVEIYLLTGIAAVISAMVTARTKRLGDLAAGTYVIAERSRIQLPPPPVAPPELEGWARRADIAALEPDLAVAVRQFLPRAPLLVPTARQELGRQLLARVLPRVAPAPPPGHHPEAVLAAVMAERYRRDLERLQREQSLRERVLPRSM
ncbi:RDD family protein [Intrasporangium sp. DVR]|uniref:RDD family protein n=1 Tax=Intrasporangium sp. DVR TaxID=3127867 RepID=UPI00313A6CAD